MKSFFVRISWSKGIEIPLKERVRFELLLSPEKADLISFFLFHKLNFTFAHSLLQTYTRYYFSLFFIYSPNIFSLLEYSHYRAGLKKEPKEESFWHLCKSMYKMLLYVKSALKWKYFNIFHIVIFLTHSFLVYCPELVGWYSKYISNTYFLLYEYYKKLLINKYGWEHKCSC